MLFQALSILALTIGGAAISTILATLPVGSAIHICGLLFLVLTNLTLGSAISTTAAITLTTAVAVGYTFGSTIPALVFQCTDESSLYFPPLGNRVAADGQLHHAILYTGIGSLGAIFTLLLIAPLAKFLLPHLEWLYTTWHDPLLAAALLCLIASLVIDSWRNSHTGRGKESDRLSAGLFTVLLSGLAGLILELRPLGSIQVADMHLTPLFLGLWVIPWLIKNINNRPSALKEQPPATKLSFCTRRTIFAIFSGSLVGLICLVAAIVSPCAMAIAGWFLMRRERRLQLIGQSAARTILIVGGVIMLFVPGLPLYRGHFDWFFQEGDYSFSTWDFTMALAAMVVAAVASFYLLAPMANMAISFARNFPRYLIPAISVGLIILSVGYFFHLQGLLVLLVGCAIGGYCLAYGGRRTSCLGAVLIPALCHLLGITDYIASILSL